MTSILFSVRDLLETNWVDHAGGVAKPSNITAGRWKGKLNEDIITVERYRQRKINLSSDANPDYECWDQVRVVMWVEEDATSEETLDQLSDVVEAILISHSDDAASGVQLALISDPVRTEDMVAADDVPEGFIKNEVHLEAHYILVAT